VFFGKAAVVDGGQSILQGFGRPGGMLSEEALCEGHVGRLSGVVTWNGEESRPRGRSRLWGPPCAFGAHQKVEAG